MTQFPRFVHIVTFFSLTPENMFSKNALNCAIARFTRPFLFCCKFILLYLALIFTFCICKLLVNYAKHYFDYKRTFTLPFQSEICIFFKKNISIFFQTLVYMLIWSSKVVTWVWFLAWAILLAKNNARSWKVALFSQSTSWLVS